MRIRNLHAPALLRWAPLLVLLLGLLATALVTYQLARSEAEKDRERFKAAVQLRQDGIRDRMDMQVAMLRGVAGFLITHREITRDEFQLYVSALHLAENFPGVLGIGFTQRIPSDELEAFERAVSHDFVGFHVWPDTPRDEYHTIVYLEPLDRRNRAAIGYDMYSEPVRQAAMARARDTGEPVASGRVTLVQEIDEDKQAGFNIYVPIYREGLVPDTLEERREQLIGFAYSPLRAGDLLSRLVSSEVRPWVAFSVYDGALVDPAELMYRSAEPPPDPRFTAVEHVQVADHVWTIEYATLPAFEAASSSGLVPMVAGSGVILSLLLAGLSLLQARTQAARRASTQALQDYREAVRREEKLYRLAVDQVKGYAIFLVSPNGRMNSWNAGVAEVLGWEEHEFIGRPLSVIFPPEVARAAETELQAAREREVVHSDRWQVRKDGTRFWASGLTTRLQDEAGDFVGYLKVMRDLTESRLQQETIAAQERQLRLIADTLPVLIAYIDTNECYRFYNRCYAEWYGAQGQLSIGRPIRQVMGEESYAIWQPYLARALAGETLHFSSWMPHAAGSARYLSVHYAPDIASGGQVRGVVLMAEDITARKQAEDRTRNILESITEAFYALDEEGRFSYVNERAVEYFRQPRDSLLGRFPAEVVPAACDEEFHAAFARATNTQTPVAFVQHSAFSGRIIDVRVYPAADGLSVYFRDITEQQLAEDERNRQARTLQFLLELNQATASQTEPEAITAIAARLLGEHLDVDRCAYAYIDDECRNAEVTGDYVRGVPSIVGRYPLELFGEELVRHTEAGTPLVVEDIQELDLSASQLAQYSQLLVSAMIYVPLHKSGRVVAALAVHQRRPRRWTADEVELVQLVATRCWEALERAQVAGELRESEERLRALVETTPECVKLVTREGKLAYINRAGIGMLEAEDAAALLDKPVIDLIAPEYRDDWLARHERVCAGERLSWQFEVIGLRGTRHWMETHAVPLPMEDGQAGQLAISREITGRKRIERKREQLLLAERSAREEAERVVRMKDEFLATLSHELRTPLSAMLGWAQLLRHRRLNPDETAAGLEAIERNAKVQQQLIEDLLDMSRIVSGKVRLELQPVSLVEVVETALDIVRPTANAKRITLEEHFERPLGRINGDPARLQQVLWNLLTNAIKFTPTDGTIEVRLRQCDQQLELSVTDTGTGIPSEFLPHVFDRFSQLDSSSTRRFGGLGLGLSIVKSLVEMHGGSVQVDSPGEGQGATFTVFLPVAVQQDYDRWRDEDSARRSAEEAVPVPVIPELCGVKVLVVDDDPDARALLTRIFLEAEAQVLTAGDAETALARLRQERPALLVSDIGMPNVDGYALIRQVRALPAGLGGDTPAIALTAFARADDRNRALAAGYERHLTKPIEAATLLTACGALLAQAGTPDAVAGGTGGS